MNQIFTQMLRTYQKIDRRKTRVINVGNVLTLADHQLTHVLESYAFDQIRLSIPENSTPVPPKLNDQEHYYYLLQWKMNLIF